MTVSLATRATRGQRGFPGAASAAWSPHMGGGMPLATSAASRKEEEREAGDSTHARFLT